jgi:hypothetical protein
MLKAAKNGGIGTSIWLRTKGESAIKNGPETLLQQRPGLTTMRRNRTMAKALLPPTELLRQLISYEPETGKCIWLPRPAQMFKTKRHWSVWNARYAGKPALNCLKNGYRVGAINDRLMRQHRVIWKWMTGQEPDEIDHINGNRADNRWANLRSVTHKENTRNAGAHMARQFPQGVYKRGRTWQARIKVDGKPVTIGSFATELEAVEAREAAKVELGFHRNHGRSTG